MIENALTLVISLLERRDLFWSLFLLMPMIIIVELPFYLIILLSVCYGAIKVRFIGEKSILHYPMMTCVICAYSEGKDILKSMNSMLEQRYPGVIEILVVVDDAKMNQTTYLAAKQFANQHAHTPKRYFQVIPRTSRGGRASSLNLGLFLAKGALLLALDGDTSCDNDVFIQAVKNFDDENLVGLSGALRVRNAKVNLLTRLQSLEYLLGIQMSRTGLGNLNILNNISGASGIFRTDFVRKIGGWKNGSAEDLDMIMRIKAYFRRYPLLRMQHDSNMVSHTDVPTRWKGLLKQRLRWEGDLFFIICRRHWRSINPRKIGWMYFFGMIWSELFLLMIIPMCILISLPLMWIYDSFSVMLSVLMLGYLYYLALSFLIFSVYWLLLSERKKEDLKSILYLPVLPIYNFIMRVWAALAILSEILFSTHKDTSMAPWWVLRKGEGE